MMFLADRIKYIFLLILVFSACNKKEISPSIEIVSNELKDTIENTKPFIPQFEDSLNFKNLALIDPSILQEIRYADTNNFTGIKIYDCAACFLQNEVAFALQQAQVLAKEKHLGIKVFDCYRAFDYQVKLYNAFPNINYVAKPSKGSMHSLGCAVDLTLVDSLGNELDMGTAFDSFDKKSYTYNTEIDTIQQANRKTLRTIMEAVGFAPIKTEWWHFSFKNCNKSVNDNLKWTCE